MPNIETDIDIKDPKWLELCEDINQHTQKAIETVLLQQIPHAEHIEISIVLANDSFVRNLNKNYRNKDKATNVLSFPQTELNEMSSPFLMLGDIIIASGVIKKEAEEQKKTLKDHYTHILIHGCLHLLHYDHITDQQAEEMETLEASILNKLNIKNPYTIK